MGVAVLLRAKLRAPGKRDSGQPHTTLTATTTLPLSLPSLHSFTAACLLLLPPHLCKLLPLPPSSPPSLPFIFSLSLYLHFRGSCQRCGFFPHLTNQGDRGGRCREETVLFVTLTDVIESIFFLDHLKSYQAPNTTVSQGHTKDQPSFYGRFSRSWRRSCLERSHQDHKTVHEKLTTQ